MTLFIEWLRFLVLARDAAKLQLFVRKKSRAHFVKEEKGFKCHEH